MKKMWPVALLFLTGCESKQVKLYVEQLQAMLQEYQGGVNGRMAAERKMYAEMAERHAVEAEREVYESLRIERSHRQRVVTGALAEKRMTPAQAFEAMRETAALEVDKVREFFEREMSIESTYQAGLARVALDAKKIQALDTALLAMKESKGLPVEFAQAFQKEFQAQECKAVAREIAVMEESLAILKAEKRAEEAKTLAAELAVLQTRKCK